MPDLDIVDHLQNVVHPDFLVRAQGGMIVIEEADPGSTNRRFELDASCRCVALKLDFPRPSSGRVQVDKALPFFRCDAPGLTAKCDMIVFVAAGGETGSAKAFLVEMKSLRPGNSMTQMLSSREFAKYLFAVAKLHGVPCDSAEFFGLRIRRKAIPAKGTSRPPRPKFETHRESGFKFCDWDASFPLTVRALRDAA
ncbi:MAG: hypothetical protein MUE42_09195 [Opitutaceae bacterium]|jgi:hypothetical protein|nr:hypothetical protein [Opitutaceae bacterium]